MPSKAIQVLVLTGMLCYANVATPLPIRGVSGEVLDTVSAYLNDLNISCQEPENRVDGFAQEVNRRARRALDALGYYQARISNDVQRSDDCWQVETAIEPGERAVIASWQASTSASLRDDIQASSLVASTTQTGGPFIPTRYETTKSDLLTQLKDLGFLDVQFKRSRVDISDKNHASIDWELDGGSYYEVGPITLDQQVLDSDLLVRYLSLVEGNRFRMADVIDSRKELLASDVFLQVEVEPLYNKRQEGRIPVRIDLTPARQWSVVGGAGVTTDTGPRLRLQAINRYVNSRGHRGSLGALASRVFGNLNGEYRLPFGDPRHQWFSVGAKLSYEETDAVSSRIANVEVRRSQRIFDKWTQTILLDYRIEDFEVSGDIGRTNLLLVGHNLSTVSLPGEPRPIRGRSLSFDVRGATKSLLSDNDFLQVRLAAKQILPLGHDTRLLLRLDIGHTWQDSFRELPPSLRFFAGGDRSVRGFGLHSLGPRDNSNRTIGGKRLLTGSVEVDKRIKNNSSIAAFLDVGTAFDTSFDPGHSVGIGIRWYSPLGPIRADLAHPLSQSDRAVRFHLSIGPDL